MQLDSKGRACVATKGAQLAHSSHQKLMPLKGAYKLQGGSCPATQRPYSTTVQRSSAECGELAAAFAQHSQCPTLQVCTQLPQEGALIACRFSKVVKQRGKRLLSCPRKPCRKPHTSAV